jgi:hypothetical protein
MAIVNIQQLPCHIFVDELCEMLLGMCMSAKKVQHVGVGIKVGKIRGP